MRASLKLAVRLATSFVVVGAIIVSVIVSVREGYWWLPVVFYVGCPVAVVLIAWAFVKEEAADRDASNAKRYPSVGWSWADREGRSRLGPRGAGDDAALASVAHRC